MPLVDMTTNPEGHVSARRFQEYLETFHKTYRSKLNQPFFEQHRVQLWKWRALQGRRIAGYVSTSYGVGYEYIAAESQTIEVAYGSRRIDAQQFRCSARDLEHHGKVAVLLSGRDFTMV